MKKVTLILAALALVLGITQCKKQEKPAQIGEKQHIVLTANNGNDGSKVNVTSATTKLNLTWESTDKINVSGAVEGTLDLTGEPGSATAKFEGTVTRKTGNQVVFTVGNQPTYLGQAGTLAGLKDLIHLKGTSPYEEDGEYSALMELQFAVLKLDLSYFGPETGSTTVTIKAGGSPVASVTGITAASKEVYVALPAASNFTFTSTEGKTVTKEDWTLAANKFYTLQGTTDGSAIVIEPAPQGRFTVGMDGSTPRKVEFAPGNLYYDGSSWHFEANQWDYRTYGGKNSCIDGNVTTNGTPSGHWGMFGWSTPATTYGMSISTSSTDYSGDFKDWGKNAIGTNAADTWRTLSKAEWGYLLNSRDGATSLRAWKDLGNGIKGLVILPDGTENPSGVLGSITSTDALATYGAVFLPAAGNRSGASVKNVGGHGFYWSSTPNGSDSAHGMYFNSGELYPNDDDRYDGYAVRLVR